MGPKKKAGNNASASSGSPGRSSRASASAGLLGDENAYSRRKSPKANLLIRPDIFLEEKLSIISSRSSRASSSFGSLQGSFNSLASANERPSTNVKSTMSKKSLNSRSQLATPGSRITTDVLAGVAFSRMKKRNRERNLRALDELRTRCASIVRQYAPVI